MTKPQINLIWAENAEDYIGKNGTIPWRHAGDMERFKKLTTGHTVIMGRKTWESLPEKYRPLPDRKNVVLMRDVTKLAVADMPEGVVFTESLESALLHVPEGQIAWIIGGKQIYELALPIADLVYVTVIDDFTIGDVKAPDKSNFKAFDCTETGVFTEEPSDVNFWEVWQRRNPTRPS